MKKNDSSEASQKGLNKESLQDFVDSYKDNPLNDFDSIFYELDEKTPLDEIQIEYIRANMMQFTTE